jgi:hypothetical protein
MAVAHMFHLVLAVNTNAYEQQKSVPSSSASTQFQAGNGGKFIARVLERGGLSGIVENLRDGPVKLQQAYLNIINIVFCPNLFERMTGLTVVNGQLVAVKGEHLSYTGSNTNDGIPLKQTRIFFLKSSGWCVL